MGGSEGEVIVASPGPCANCGEAAYILRRSGDRLCARCYGREHPPAREEPPAAAG